MERTALEARWLDLTRRALPEAARGRDWPVRLDHCFQRILLDDACGCVWHEAIAKRPAYRHAPGEILARAVRRGEEVLSGDADLWALDAASLEWRGKAPKRARRA